jgi:formylmethanofuran dehydrogenase subunit D
MLNTRVNENKLTEITLTQSKVWSIEGDRRGEVINCLSGVIWITQADDLNDYILEAGDSFWVTKRGTVIVQALQNAQFKYSLNELQSHIEANTQPAKRSAYPRVIHHLR